ncbi:nucleoside deaminase [Lactobacillus bombi]|nr:nucleoside deaminase [Bombilactobacillus bombi]MBA1435127.1 nucleoside deaminase [Bombilactobacillus bombi]
MQQTILVAQQALKYDEVPIGALIVDNNTKQVIASGFNQREVQQRATAHAEILAIENACQKTGSWRLEHHSLFVTLEPCPMCAGAIINSRIATVAYGAHDPKAGSVGSLTNLFSLNYNHQPDFIGGVLEQQCGKLLTDFFKAIRARRN